MYSNVVVLAWSDSKIMLGYIPNNTVINNKVIKIVNSLLEISFKGSRCGE